VNELTARVDTLLTAGNHRGARATLATAMLTRPTTVTCHIVADKLAAIDAAAAGLTPVKVAVLTNYTVDPLLPLLQARALPSGLKVSTYAPGFDLWMPELVDPDSGLRKFAPDVVILDLLPESLAPELSRSFLALDRQGVEAASNAIVSVIESGIGALRTWSKARLLVHAMPRPIGPVLGIVDANPGGQQPAFAALNDRLRDLCRAVDAYVVDTDRLVADVGIPAWRDHRMWSLAKIPYGAPAMHRIADEHVRYLRAFTGRGRKVLVLDLDDTLWGGVLGERGEHALDLGDTHPGNGFVDFQHAIAELRRRGVILALNSSNDADEALAVMRRHESMVLRPDDFSAMRVNWQDKAQNMVELAEELNLGLDSFVFIDNSDTECARLREALPEVLTCQLTGDPAGFGPWLRQSGLFDSLGYSEEDRQRGELYRGEVQRAKHRESIGSLDEFLASLQMELTAEAVTDATAARAADLTQRTNQFNMTTERRTADEIRGWRDANDRVALVFSLTDRFGPQGIIAFAALQITDGAAVITDLLISCRVLKRHVEDAILAILTEQAVARGAGRIVARFRPTRRNAAFEEFYPSRGFTAADDSAKPADGEVVRRWQLEGTVPRPKHIVINTRESVRS
jgi:FkbH-like protein